MGEWNQTCALSRLPIRSEDKVMWMLLVQSRYLYQRDGRLNAGVEPCAFWVPRCLPIMGEYDSYGRIDNAEPGILQDMVLDMFRLDMVDRKRDGRMKTLGTPALNRKNLTLALLQDWLHDGYVMVDQNAVEREEAIKQLALSQEIDKLVRKGSKEKRETDKKPFSGISKRWRRAAKLPVEAVPVVRIMILKDVWDHLCTMPICREMFGGFSFDDIRQHVDEFVADLVRQREERKQETESILGGLHKTYPVHDEVLDFGVIYPEKTAQNKGLEELKRSRSFYFLEQTGGPYSMSVGRQVKMARDGVIDGTISEQDATTIFHRAIDFAIVRSHVNELRITWGPQTGEGSQLTGLDSHMRFAKFVTKYAYETDRAGLVKNLEDEKQCLKRSKKKDRKRYYEDIEITESEIRLLDVDYTCKGLLKTKKGRSR